MNTDPNTPPSPNPDSPPPSNPPPSQPPSEELSYETKLIVTILLFIAFYPAGLVAMFIWNIGPMWLRIVLFLPLAYIAFLLLAAFSMMVFHFMGRIF